MKPWGDEANPDHLEQVTEENPDKLEKLAHEYLKEVERKRGAEDPFDYTPWIAALPMPFTKEIEQGLRVNGLKLRKQIQADRKRNPLLWDLKIHAGPRLQIVAEGGMEISESDKTWEKSQRQKVFKLAERLASEAQRQSQ